MTTATAYPAIVNSLAISPTSTPAQVPSLPENDGNALVLAASLDPANADSPALPFTINPDLKHFLPPLSESELKLLQDDIKNNGVQEPLFVRRIKNAGGSYRRELLDGHNRVHICEKLGIDPQRLAVVEVELDDLLSAKMWVLDHQFMKRNLTPMKQSYCRGMIYEGIKVQGFKGNQHTGGGQNGRKQNSAAEIGKRFGVSAKTIWRDALFAKRVNALSLEDRVAVLAGKKSLPKVAIDKPRSVTVSTEEVEYSCTIDNLAHLTFAAPQETADALSLVIDKAGEYIDSLPSSPDITVNGQGLRKRFEGLLAKIESKEHHHNTTE